jgi:undecaprenyl-diphosphatase
MPFFDIVILAIIQGITEFLPVSSSGHLVLAHHLMGNTDETANMLMDIAVHIGTLLAVLLYFRRDIAMILCGLLKREAKAARLALLIIIGSIPVIIAGFIINFYMPLLLRSLHVLAWSTIFFGILLWVADKYSPKNRNVEDLTYKDALLIGMAQILALIPGTSRSGITMTAGRFVGLSALASARYSLLLSIVAISGAGALGSLSLLETQNITIGADILLAMLLSFLAALAAIDLMMRWLAKAGFTPFVIYRIGLGIILLGLIYGGVLV